MTTFSVGMRVKKIRHRHESDAVGVRLNNKIGATGTVVGANPLDGEIRVQMDAGGMNGPDGFAEFMSYMLAPLTDPKADAFIESVKKWKPEPVAPALPTINNIRENAK